METNNNLLKYTNGRGHLIMSLACILAGVLIIIFAPNLAAYGATLIGTVASAWFVPGAAKQVAEKVKEKVTDALPSPVEEQKQEV